ncbi:hypothetical protein V1264_004308 [Littorina saxatilis]|uniref:ATP-dependent DNA helicase n=1 Tax=Littorina saxatilis TaxID=31220 RepID=A0AAN9G6H9_9CAEN
MSHRATFEALDRTLQDLRKNDTLMGGVTIVLAGDFRQTLPVIPRGTKADQLQACVKSSYLWKHTQRLSLKTNMRVYLTGDASAGQFAENLLSLGNGDLTPDGEDGSVSLDHIGQPVTTLSKLKYAVFPLLGDFFRDRRWLCERAILAPTNEAVKATNKELLQELPGPVHTYKSVDTVPDDNEAVNYPTEFLNSLQPAGVPPHELNLKLGTPVMLMRNLDPPTLCNGTRLMVKTMLPM